jgi:glycosyltransferase involved in cell wall biosynthesis
MPERRLRFFLGVAEIGGYYRDLQRGLEELGHDAVFVDLHPQVYRYAGRQEPKRPGAARFAAWAARRDVATPRNRALRKTAWRLTSRSARVPLFLWAIATRDVFVYSFATSFFGFRELPLLRLLGKRTIFVFHGSDSRPPYLDGSDMALDRGLTTEQCIALVRRKKDTVRTIERHADVIVSNPLSSQLHERPVASFLAIGIPRRAAAGNDSPAEVREAVRIVHSPTHPEAKGTPAIRAAVERLRGLGLAVDYVEVTGRPNADVLAELARCDIAVDQLYSDTPLAGFAAEAASLGKPVLVGGYGRDAMIDALAETPFPPVCFCKPEELDQALEGLARDALARTSLGTQAKRFLEEHWDCRVVAARFVRLADGTAPPSWFHDPREELYAEGAGLERGHLARIVRAVVAEGGREALCVGDKPALERRLLELAEGAVSGAAD